MQHFLLFTKWFTRFTQQYGRNDSNLGVGAYAVMFVARVESYTNWLWKSEVICMQRSSKLKWLVNNSYSMKVNLRELFGIYSIRLEGGRATVTKFLNKKIFQMYFCLISKCNKWAKSIFRNASIENWFIFWCVRAEPLLSVAYTIEPLRWMRPPVDLWTIYIEFRINWKKTVDPHIPWRTNFLSFINVSVARARFARTHSFDFQSYERRSIYPNFRTKWRALVNISVKLSPKIIWRAQT